MKKGYVFSNNIYIYLIIYIMEIQNNLIDTLYNCSPLYYFINFNFLNFINQILKKNIKNYHI